MDNKAAVDIDGALREIIDQIAPDAFYLPKYGGELFAPFPGDEKVCVGGIFVYTRHLTLEFTHGAELDDPYGLLEGKAKYRRHLKLRTVEEVTAKKVRFYLEQALAT